MSDQLLVCLNSVSFLWMLNLPAERQNRQPEFRLCVSDIKLVHANAEAGQTGSVCNYLSHAWGDGGSCDEDDIGSKLSCPEDL